MAKQQNVCVTEIGRDVMQSVPPGNRFAMALSQALPLDNGVVNRDIPEGHFVRVTVEVVLGDMEAQS